MGYLEDIDAAYQNAANAAASWAGVNAQAQHDAHKVMQRLVQERDAYLASQRRQPPPPPPPSPSRSYSAPPPYSPPAPPPPPPPRPPAWLRDREIAPPSGVKQADPDIIITVDEPISPEFLIQTNYEDLAGMELINISRSDIIDGINVAYSPIKNLSSIRRRYNPNNIISMPELSASYFSRFGIDLVLRGINKPFFDAEGNLIIEVDRVLDDELIEVEISDSGTINEVDFT